MISWQHALHRSPDDFLAATELGLLLRCSGREHAAHLAHRHAHAVCAPLRATCAHRLHDGGRLFGAAEPPLPALASAALLLRHALLPQYAAPHAAALLGAAARGEAGGPPDGEEWFRRRLDERAVHAMEAREPRAATLYLLFLLGRAVARREAEARLGASAVAALVEAGLLLPHATDAALVLSPVQVYPLALPAASCPLLIATDWPLESRLPTRLTVMPIGVDSLQLALGLPPTAARGKRVLDVCCGSGVQALAAAAAAASHVTAIDASARALRFTHFNAALNRLSRRLTARLADATAPLAATYDLILANPPFLAMPPHALPRGYQPALYTSGGADGAGVLRALLHHAADALARGGCLVAVSQLPNAAAAALRLAGPRRLDLTLCFNPRHTQRRREYAAQHAADAGADAAAWEEGMRAAGVRSVGFGVVIARGAAGRGVDRHVAIDGGEGSEARAMLEGEELRQLRGAIWAYGLAPEGGQPTSGAREPRWEALVMAGAFGFRPRAAQAPSSEAASTDQL
ncbi:hypothetical protein AB1Y20_021508 [Prymnesium parvum]|uniref:Methyltransferase small domain-containing protein n=1 Tax=Prymnesium parvum TaxID=97485 RepID=A0AB34JM94_PRYPA